ncbi:helix-turn-helix domain-containing protein [uncultured Gemmiger sp.]|uniref:winged helix-turn-helix transcriptional regulator n=1 Tax=uncultured Gemmiger sp. TaxID=1623490 RepID=UPI0025EDF2D0|nr:helix-turn-helix domain-containing protein [uncultured Gemmiger sp.]
MSDYQNRDQHRFAVNGIKNTGFYYTKSLLEGKYKLPILYCLQLDGPTRYNELQRKMETATFRSLSKALKELETDGLITRKDYGEIPPRVEYSLSERGKSLEPVLDAFCLWGQEHRNDK